MTTKRSMREVIERSTLGLGAAALLGLMAASVCPSASLAAGPAGVTDAALWLDAAQLTGLNNGDTVPYWTDMSGNNNHLSASGSAATYQANALNGQPVVRFNPDGNASFNFARISTIRTVFWVLKRYPGSGSFMLGDSDLSGPAGYAFHAGFERGPTLWSFQYTAASIQNGTTKLMGTPVDGTWAILPDNTYSLLSLVTTGDVQANQLSYDRVYAGRSWQGDMAEVVIYTRQLSAAEEIKVGNYLAAKYGLQTEYPSPGMMYWDNNGNTPGFGTVAGTWAAPTTGNATQGWSTNYLGETTPADTTTTLSDRLYFGFGPNGLGGSDGVGVTVDGTVAASNITFAAASVPMALWNGTITLADTTTIRVDNNADYISSVLAGAATSLTKAGGGTLYLYGPNTYTGVTAIVGGSIQFDSPAAVGLTSKITVNNGCRMNSFPQSANGGTISTPIELIGWGNGPGMWDAGALKNNLAGSFTYSGPITLLGSAAIKSYTHWATLMFSGSIGGTGNLLLNGGGASYAHQHYFVLSGASTFSGDLEISNVGASAQVTLSGGDNRLPATAVVRIGSGWGWDGSVSSVLNLGGCQQTLAGLADNAGWSLTGYRRVVNTGVTLATLTLNTGGDHVFSGNIGGTDIAGNTGDNLALVKTGIGTQTLVSACSYIGSTAVSNGVLRVTGTQVLPTTTDVYISTVSGAKLELAFEGTNTVRSLTINGELQERKVYSAANRPLVLSGTGFLAVTEGTSGGTLIWIF